jgi:hypothetical protein
MAKKKPKKSGRAARRRPAKDFEQKSLPGAETPRNEKVHSAALFVLDKLHALSDAGAELKEAQASLIAIMHAEKVPIYHYAKVHAYLENTESVKVKEDKEPKPKKQKGKEAA